MAVDAYVTLITEAYVSHGQRWLTVLRSTCCNDFIVDERLKGKHLRAVQLLVPKIQYSTRITL